MVILDAAVLLEAGWDDMCHEVWTTMVPKPEVYDRVMMNSKLVIKTLVQCVNSKLG